MRTNRWGFLGSLSVLFVVIAATAAFGWSSFESGGRYLGTHQMLNEKAYRRLEKHPAFPSSRFPPLEEIQMYSGVGPELGEGFTLEVTGGGPDNPSRSYFSWHYYNPKSGLGRGPDIVDKYFRNLAINLNAPGMITFDDVPLRQPSPPARNAAYGAHYIQDMACAFHVIGMPRPGGGAIAQRMPPGAEISGPWRVFDRMLWEEVVKRAEEDKDGKTDWFDPNYYDGYGATAVKGSTHFSYEGVVAANYASDRGVLDRLAPFENEKKYSNLWRGSLNVRQFAVDLAHETRNLLDLPNSESRFSADEYQFRLNLLRTGALQQANRDMRDFIRPPYRDWGRAIEATYSLWRGSFCALQVENQSVRLQETEKPGVYLVRLRVKNLEPNEIANDVKIFFTTGEGASGEGKAWFGNVGQTSGWMTANGEVRFQNQNFPQGKMLIEIQGAYRKEIPDSGTHRTVILLSNSLIDPIPEMPDMLGSEGNFAKDLLEKAPYFCRVNLKPGEPAKTKGSEDRVASQFPPPRTPLKRGTSVTLTVHSAYEENTPNISGSWNSSINFTYSISQSQSTFSWTVTKPIAETGSGTIRGKAVEASWKGKNGQGSAKGTVTKQDSSGRATEIRWSNGVIFMRD
jgi:hypothetical protein